MAYYVCDGNGVMTLFSFMWQGSVEEYITEKYGNDCTWGAITQLVDERRKDQSLKTSEPGSDPLDEEVEVLEFDYGGKTYLRDADGVVYHPEFHIDIGVWKDGKVILNGEAKEQEQQEQQETGSKGSDPLEEESQTNPPYYCDGGCNKIVGHGKDHDCKRICEQCEADENRSDSDSDSDSDENRSDSDDEQDYYNHKNTVEPEPIGYFCIGNKAELDMFESDYPKKELKELADELEKYDFLECLVYKEKPENYTSLGGTYNDIYLKIGDANERITYTKYNTSSSFALWLCGVDITYYDEEA